MRILPDEDLLTVAAERLIALCRARGLTIATAESCTGGLIAATLTAVAGCSDVVRGGFITYDNACKTTMLGVPAAILQAYGAVSAEVAEAMAEGTLAEGVADLAVAVTGVAGPGGGSADKPVGLVWLSAVRTGGQPFSQRAIFVGDRQQIRSSTVGAALALLEHLADG